MNAIRRFGMHQRNANASQEVERDKTLFIIAKPIVLERESQPSKDFLSIDEIKALILEVRSSLGFTPRKPHCISVYTFRRFIKAGVWDWPQLLVKRLAAVSMSRPSRDVAMHGWLESLFSCQENR